VPALGYHLLDSGALYRLVGLAAERAGLPPPKRPARTRPGADRLGALAAGLQVRFTGQHMLLDGEDVTEPCAPSRRHGRLARVGRARGAGGAAGLQHGFRQFPGLVADGRDMGTVIFPMRRLKVYLTASAAQRAERRHKQLISKGIAANIADLLADLEMRDLSGIQPAATRRSSPPKTLCYWTTLNSTSSNRCSRF
jgi:3-phosphoshikimate 1-carboxyvinyltransferase